MGAAVPTDPCVPIILSSVFPYTDVVVEMWWCQTLWEHFGFRELRNEEGEKVETVHRHCRTGTNTYLRHFVAQRGMFTVQSFNKCRLHFKIVILLFLLETDPFLSLVEMSRFQNVTVRYLLQYFKKKRQIKTP